jgi:hypothetical protein
MSKKTIKMRYKGPVPVRIPGINGHINPHDEIDVPEEMANNLDRDFFFKINESKKKEAPRIPKKNEKKEVKDE